MKKSGADAEQIAEATGLSVSYIRKIKGSGSPLNPPKGKVD